MYSQVNPWGTAPPPPIASHQFAAPTAAESLAALIRVMGRERGTAAWTEACRKAGVRAATGLLSPDDLGRAIEALAAQGGAVASVARAIQIRLRTYRRLAARATEVVP